MGDASPECTARSSRCREGSGALLSRRRARLVAELVYSLAKLAKHTLQCGKDGERRPTRDEVDGTTTTECPGLPDLSPLLEAFMYCEGYLYIAELEGNRSLQDVSIRTTEEHGSYRGEPWPLKGRTTKRQSLVRLRGVPLASLEARKYARYLHYSVDHVSQAVSMDDNRRTE